MTPEDIALLAVARRAVELGVGRSLREDAGLNRTEFVAYADNAFTVAALRAWESGVRRPRGRHGIAYGRALIRLAQSVGADA